MKAEFENLKLVKNEDKMRFEMQYNNHLGFIDYEVRDNGIALTHTELEPEIQGTGAGMALVEKTLTYLKEHGQKVLPYCSYVFAFIKRHPEWKEIVAEDFIFYNKL